MISIILPNLNTDVRFLTARIQSILSQTYGQWECIIIDGFSNNGSWEYLYNSTKNDDRFRLYQKPKLGIYNAWNEGIKLAKGDYIYIATSDDTMHHQFLSTMVAALENYKSCDIAHCCLQIIDENGRPDYERNWDNFLAAQFFGDLMHRKHIRNAPYDGILHAFIKTVYHSITQLLIRKKVFHDTGLFIEDGSSIADYEWGMRVSLLKNTVHIPEYLATWRYHPSQATKNDLQSDPRTYERLIEWISLNLKKAKKQLPNEFSPYSVRDLTVVYRKNKRSFNLQQLRKKNVYMYRIYQKLFPRHTIYTNGVKEAKQYFKELNLNRLITFIN